MRAVSSILGKFMRDRGTHLAAMVAYFALLAFVPLLFLALSLIALTGEQNESSYLIEELQRAFPESSVDRLLSVVGSIRESAGTVGIIGGVGLLWSALGFFSVLESAFNIVYGRPNRSFVRGKALATLFMAGSIVSLFISLVVGSVGFDLLQRFLPGFTGNGIVAYALSVLVSTLAVFVFLVFAYERLTNAKLTLRQVWPGALFAALGLQISFQVLPLFVRLSRDVVALQALGTTALLLVWLYVMANVIVFGAEVNWFLGSRREEPEIAGLA